MPLLFPLLFLWLPQWPCDSAHLLYNIIHHLHNVSSKHMISAELTTENCHCFSDCIVSVKNVRQGASFQVFLSGRPTFSETLNYFLLFCTIFWDKALPSFEYIICIRFLEQTFWNWKYANQFAVVLDIVCWIILIR